MKEKKDMQKKIEETAFAIPYKNIAIIIGGFVIMVLGYIAMIGGGSKDPNVFNPQMFSFVRTVLAPILILAGMVVIIWGIMYIRKNK